MRVLIIGDIHGQHAAFTACLRHAVADYRIAAAIQVGDFGFYRSLFESARLDGLRFPVPVYAIDGNHEEHPWLHRCLGDGSAASWPERFNLIYQERGSVAALGSSKVGFLGGALHVDRPQQREWGDGFPNYLLRADRERATAAFNRERPELIITHSCPSRIGVGMTGSPMMEPWVRFYITSAGFDAGERDDCGETELTGLWQALTYQPRAWVFGHFHHFHQATVGKTRFVGTDCDLDSPGRMLVIWDTEERQLLLCPADPSAERG